MHTPAFALTSQGLSRRGDACIADEAPMDIAADAAALPAPATRRALSAMTGGLNRCAGNRPAQFAPANLTLRSFARGAHPTCALLARSLLKAA
jgi:hypothetical protein